MIAAILYASYLVTQISQTSYSETLAAELSVAFRGQFEVGPTECSDSNPASAALLTLRLSRAKNAFRITSVMLLGSLDRGPLRADSCHSGERLDGRSPAECCLRRRLKMTAGSANPSRNRPIVRLSSSALSGFLAGLIMEHLFAT